MKKTKDRNKGITLIALVITIIVMLILVAVTITMAVKGGLFDYAGRAGSETNTKRDEEQEFANLQPDMTYDDLISKYTGATGESDGCDKCTDGYIFIGYSCNECDVVSSSYEVLNYGCLNCSDMNLQTEECPTCGEDARLFVKRCTLSACSHTRETLMTSPRPETSKCPDCWINFTACGDEYSALKGVTWEEWVNGLGYQIEISVREEYVLTGFDVEQWYLTYEDGTKVKRTDKIEART